MFWEGIRNGFFDELEKISEINLSGLSPETILKNSQPPPPMETPGYSKARDILQRAEIIKTSQAEDTVFDRAAKTIGPTLGGMALGKGVGELANVFRPGTLSDEAKRKLMAAGAVLGTANTAYKKVRDYRNRKQLEQPMQKTQEMVKLSSTPAHRLKASKQVGTVGTSVSTAGPSIKSQTSGLIGKKFQI
jgi:hypothetical protein